MLSETGAIVVDKGEFGRLGIEKVGDHAEVFGHRLRIVGTVTGLRSLAGPYVFCSLETAKLLLHPPADQTTFLLARCKNPRDATKIAEQMNVYPSKINVFTAEQFSFNSRWHWLTKTKAGIAARLRGPARAPGRGGGDESDALRGDGGLAQGVRGAAGDGDSPVADVHWRSSSCSQSSWIGISGIVCSVPAILGVASIGSDLGAKVILPWWLWVGAVSITMCMAMIAGLFALRQSPQHRADHAVALTCGLS